MQFYFLTVIIFHCSMQQETDVFQKNTGSINEAFESMENDNKVNRKVISKEICDFINSLSNEQKMLIVLKKQLYEGSWEPMLDDLRNRLEGKPYIFKLANRIQDDIERIEQMMMFEKEHQIDLADYVELQ